MVHTNDYPKSSKQIFVKQFKLFKKGLNVNVSNKGNFFLNFCRSLEHFYKFQTIWNVFQKTIGKVVNLRNKEKCFEVSETKFHVCKIKINVQKKIHELF